VIVYVLLVAVAAGWIGYRLGVRLEAARTRGHDDHWTRFR
jgi:hypothetical protein